MIWGNTSNYTGTNTDLQREKRMSEYQRAMMLRPAQREMVQARMIADPYDRDASTRLERINERVNADPYTSSRTSQAYRDAIANRLYEQPQSYEQSRRSDNAYSRAQRSAQTKQAEDPSNQFAVGEINGNRVVAPQAGHYNEYQAVMARLGLGDSPSPEAFSYAMDQQRIDPNKRYESDSKVEAAYAKNAMDKQKLEMQRQQMMSRERIQAGKTNAKDFKSADKSIDSVSGEKGYNGYIKSFRSALKDVKDMTPDEAQTYFQGQGIPYSDAGGKYVPLPRNKWTPGMGSEGDPKGDAMRAAQETPGGAMAVQQRLRQSAMSPAGQQVEDIYRRTGLGQDPALAQSAPQAPVSVESDAQNLSRTLQVFEQRGMSRQQALQEVMRKAQTMGPAAQQRIQAVIQRFGDRILQTQVQ